MVAKPYEWTKGAVLEEHSKRKHKVLEAYFRRYLLERCKNPISRRFRLAIVDAFAGAGRYSGGEPGSPLIFLSTLLDTVQEINLRRVTDGMPSVEVQCLLILSDAEPDAIDLLRGVLAPLEAAAKSGNSGVELQTQYHTGLFEHVLPTLQAAVEAGRYRNLIYNLDQCGHSHVELTTISKLMASEKSVEIFYTYSIQALITYLNQSDPEKVNRALQHLGLDPGSLDFTDRFLSKNEWLGSAERLVYNHFRKCAPFVSPFSIHNPNGWRYWFIHFATADRARQVYNDVLHANSSEQAHYGRAGLRMLSYNPEHERGSLYLFDESARDAARAELPEDIPRLISEGGDMMPVSDFYRTIYNQTPAHSDDIHEAIMENPDLEVITSGGGERRKARTIGRDDTIRLKKQMSFSLK